LNINIGNTRITRRCKDGYMLLSSLFIESVEAIQYLATLFGKKGVFCGTPALRDDNAHVMRQGILFQVEEGRQALNTFSLSSRTGHEGNTCIRSHGMCPLNIQRGFSSPAKHCWIIGIKRHFTKGSIDFEGWWVGQIVAYIEGM